MGCINRYDLNHIFYPTRARPPGAVIYRHGLQQIGCCKRQPPPVLVIDGAGLGAAILNTAASSDFAVDGYRWWVLSGTKSYRYLIGTCPRNGLTACENQALLDAACT